jgi:Fic family protein
MMFQLPKLDDSELAVVDEIEGLRRQLSYATQARRWTGLLRRSTFARAVQGSNSIEGINVSVDDAIAIAEGEEPLDTDAITRAAITGYQNAMTYVLQLADDPHFSYSVELIRSLHYMMMHYDLTKHPGRWRPGVIYVRNDERGEIVYEGPDAGQVPSLMGELISWLTEGDTKSPAIIRAAMSHLNLVMIHPFSDGNGRMARCLQTLMLAREGVLGTHFCSVEEYLGRSTLDYYRVLAEVGAGKWHPERNTRPWIHFMLTAHYTQASTLLRRQKEMERVWGTLEKMIEDFELPSRAIFAVVDAAFGWKVRNSTYRPMAEITEQVASRDLKSLVDAKLLVPTGERRGRWYEASDVVKTIRARAREKKPIENPFSVVTQRRFL